MKIILHILAIFAAGALSAQSLAEPFVGAEPARSTITPYGRAVDAKSGNPAQSNYVAKLAEWVISEDGRECSSSFAVPVWWLNRQVFVRVGSSTSSYQVLEKLPSVSEIYQAEREEEIRIENEILK